MSTAYVCGERQGLIPEALLPPGHGYYNPYEESKHAAEGVVAASRLDWAILRLGILMGHSGTGEAETDKMTYGVFRTYWRLREVLANKYSEAQIRALAATPFAVLCRPEATKNLICVDDAARLMVRLFARGAPCGAIFHLANPLPAQMGAIHAAAFEVLAMDCLRLVPDLPGEMRPEERLVRRGIDMYRPYMTLDEPRFDQSALRAFLGGEVVDAILPLTHERLCFLYGTHLRRRLTAAPEAAVPPAPDAAGPDPRPALIRSHGSHSLAFSSLTNGTQTLLLPSGAGFVPYAVKGRACVMVGDPACAPAVHPEAVAAFLEFCAGHGLAPVAVQVSQAVG